jgi:hypothetical protein
MSISAHEQRSLVHADVRADLTIACSARAVIMVSGARLIAAMRVAASGLILAMATSGWVRGGNELEEVVRHRAGLRAQVLVHDPSQVMTSSSTGSGVVKLILSRVERNATGTDAPEHQEKPGSVTECNYI